MFPLIVLIMGTLSLHAQTQNSASSSSAGGVSAGSMGSEVKPVSASAVDPASPVVTVSKPVGQPQATQAAPANTAPAAPSMEPPAPVPQSGSMLAVSGDYVLKPGDSIEMIVYKEPDLSISSRFGKDGMVQLPLLGQIKLAGLTIKNTTELLRARYDADYVVSPQIYLNIVAYSTVKFTAIGQVGRPGAYEYSESEPLDLLQAIGMAGGFTRIADRGHVIIKRRDGNALKVMKVNAKKLTDSSVDRCAIENGDVINVGESWY
jgi:protein involved in polysaccharide export with SLBB domain